MNEEKMVERMKIMSAVTVAMVLVFLTYQSIKGVWGG